MNFLKSLLGYTDPPPPIRPQRPIPSPPPIRPQRPIPSPPQVHQYRQSSTESERLQYEQNFSERIRQGSGRNIPNKNMSQVSKTFNRQCEFDGSEAVREEKGYRTGVHTFTFTWRREKRGKNAVVGVGTRRAPLTGDSNTILLGGNNGESWGWNISTNKLYHNSTCHGDYPTRERQERLQRLYGPREHGTLKVCLCDTGPWMYVTFILDDSGSVGERDFNAGLKPTVKTIIESVRGVTELSQFACVVFNSSNRTEWDFSQYRTTNELNYLTERIQFKGGGTQTGDALYKVLSEFHPSIHCNAQHIVVLMTDGDEGGGAHNVRDVALQMKYERIELFCIGIGDSINKAILDEISSGSNYRFDATNYNDLCSKRQIIADQICSRAIPGYSRSNEFQVEDKFEMVLDMNEGTLCFQDSSGSLGFAFLNLNGLELFPMFSRTRCCEIIMTEYLEVEHVEFVRTNQERQENSFLHGYMGYEENINADECRNDLSVRVIKIKRNTIKCGRQKSAVIQTLPGRLKVYRKMLINGIRLTRQQIVFLAGCTRSTKEKSFNLKSLLFGRKLFKKYKERSTNLAIQCLCYAIENENTRHVVWDVLGDSIHSILLHQLQKQDDLTNSVAISIGYLTEYNLPICDEAMKILENLLQHPCHLCDYPIKNEYLMTCREMDFVTLRWRSLRSLYVAIQKRAHLSDKLIELIKVSEMKVDKNMNFCFNIPEEMKGKKDLIRKYFTKINEYLTKSKIHKKTLKSANWENIFRKGSTEQVAFCKAIPEILELINSSNKTQVIETCSFCLCHCYLDKKEFRGGNNKEILNNALEFVLEALDESNLAYLTNIKEIKRKTKLQREFIFCLTRFVEINPLFKNEIQKVLSKLKSLYANVTKLAAEMNELHQFNRQLTQEENAEEIISQYGREQTSNSCEELQNMHHMLSQLLRANGTEDSPLFENLKSSLNKTILSLEVMNNESAQLSVLTTRKMVECIYLKDYGMAINLAKLFGIWIFKIHPQHLRDHFPPEILKLLAEMIIKSKLEHFKYILLQILFVVSKEGIHPTNYFFLYHSIRFDNLKQIILEITENIVRSSMNVTFDESYIQTMMESVEKQDICYDPECDCDYVSLKCRLIFILKHMKQKMSNDIFIEMTKFVWREENTTVFQRGYELIENRLSHFDGDKEHLKKTLMQIKDSQSRHSFPTNDTVSHDKTKLLHLLSHEEMRQHWGVENSIRTQNRIQTFIEGSPAANLLNKEEILEQLKNKNAICRNEWNLLNKFISDFDDFNRSMTGLSIPDGVLQMRETLTRNMVGRESEIQNIGMTHYLAVLAMMLKGDENGRVCQVSAGEGNSLVIALLAVTLALRGNKVDIITRFQWRAKRHVKKYKFLYDLFQLRCSVNSDDHYYGGEKSCYECEIVCGSIETFQIDLLRDEFGSLKTRGGRQFSCAILEDTDEILVDEATVMASLSSTLPGSNYLDIIFAKIWESVAVLREPDIEKIKQDIHSSLEDHEIIIPRHLEDLVKEKLTVWIQSAFKANFQLKEGVHYRVIDDKIVIVDFEKSGMLIDEGRLTDGVHQFLELKHFLPIQQDCLLTNFCSNRQFIKRYESRVYGFAATLGSSNVQQFFKQIYNFDCIKIPRRHERKLIRLRNSCYFTLPWKREIAATLENIVKREKRAILIVTESLTDADEIKALVKERHLTFREVAVNANHCHSSLKFSIKTGDVIIATNLSGRRVKLCIEEQLELRGGLHVLLTFVPPNSFVKKHAFGITARRGSQGSVQIIAKTSSHEVGMSEVKRLITDEEMRTIDRWKNVDIKLDDIKHKFFNEYCESVRHGKVSGDVNRKSKHIVMEMDEKWAMWLSKTIPSNFYKDSIGANIIEKWEREWHSFQQSVDSLTNNPYYKAIHANHLLIGLEKNIWCIGQDFGAWKGKKRKILQNLNEAIEADENVSFYWHYMTSCVYLNLSSQRIGKSTSSALAEIQKADESLQIAKEHLQNIEMKQTLKLMSLYRKFPGFKPSCELYRCEMRKWNVLENIENNIETNIKAIESSRKYVTIHLHVLLKDLENLQKKLATLFTNQTPIRLDVKLPPVDMQWKCQLEEIFKPEDCSKWSVNSRVNKDGGKIFWEVCRRDKSVAILSFSSLQNAISIKLMRTEKEMSKMFRSMVELLRGMPRNGVKMNLCLKNINSDLIKKLLHLGSSTRTMCHVFIRNITKEYSWEVRKVIKNNSQVSLKYNSLRNIVDMNVFTLRNEAEKVISSFYSEDSEKTAWTSSRQMHLKFVSLDLDTAKTLAFLINQNEIGKNVLVKCTIRNINEPIFLDLTKNWSRYSIKSQSQKELNNILTKCYKCYRWSDIKVDISYQNLTKKECIKIVSLCEQYLSQCVISMENISLSRAKTIIEESSTKIEKFAVPTIEYLETYLLSGGMETVEKFNANGFIYLFHFAERPPFRTATFLTVSTFVILEFAVSTGLIASGVAAGPGAKLAMKLISEMFSDIEFLKKVYDNKVTIQDFKAKKMQCLGSGIVEIDEIYFTEILSKAITTFLKQILQSSSSRLVKNLHDERQAGINEEVKEEGSSFFHSHFNEWRGVIEKCESHPHKQITLFQLIDNGCATNREKFKNHVVRVMKQLNEKWNSNEEIQTSPVKECDQLRDQLKRVILSKLHSYGSKKSKLIEYSQKGFLQVLNLPMWKELNF